MAKSQATISLHAALTIVTALLKLEGAYKDPPKPADVHAVEGLRAGCAVLVVAAFEEFVKTCFRDELDTLQNKHPDFSKLPNKMKVSVVFGQLEKAMYGKNAKLDRLPEIFLAAGRVHNKEIFPEALNGTRSNPSPDTVAGLFKDVAYPDFFTSVHPRFQKLWRTPIHKAFPKDKLDEIVQRRHRVAHSGRALTISRVELKESVRFIRLLAQSLEAELRGHLRSVARAAR